jgi:hypothetical protein
MDTWPAHDERPYLTEAPRTSPVTWISALLVILIVAAVGYFYWFVQKPLPAAPTSVPPAPMAEPAAAPAASPAPSAEPQVRHPIEAAQPQPEQPAPSLPSLDNSDSAMRSVLARLMGKWPSQIVYADKIVRRIVATVDNLPRHAAPARMMPLRPVPGRFGTERIGDDLAIDPASFTRYAPYVALMQAIDSRTLVDTYVQFYPLFQRAYRELGYPQGYFNDRLLDAIDDLLDAPELAGAVKLAQPRILYEYADPDLEARSAGQKIMMRMGPVNEAKVKAKLREIRQALLAAAKRER